MFVLIFFQLTSKSDLKELQITLMRVPKLKRDNTDTLKVPEILNQPRPQVKKIAITNVQHSTPISTFDTLSK